MIKQLFLFSVSLLLSQNAFSFGGDPEQGGTYENVLETDAKFNEFTIINANGDDFTWYYVDDEMSGGLRSNRDKTTPKDDWLVTPAMRLEAGKEYKITLDMRARKIDAEEIFELKMGKEATVKGLTRAILPPTGITNTEGRRYIEFITVDETADYYIGLHGMSPADRSYLYFEYIGVSAPIDVNAPAAATDLKITPDIDGAAKAEITFTTPSLNVGGTTLTELTKIELLRDNELIHTFEAPATGTTVTWPDEFADYADEPDRDPMGRHTWSLLTYNSAGVGKRTSADCFIGINVPDAPTDVVAVETANVGEITISWKAPVVDVDGNPIRPENCTFDVYEVSDGTPVEVITGTKQLSVTYRALAEGQPQNMFKYSVKATNAGGTSKLSTGSRLIAAGTPYSLPYHESIPNGTTSSILGIFGISGNPIWSLMTDGDGITSQDGDGGFIGMYAEEPRTAGELMTGKIALSAERPELTFHIFNTDGADNANYVEVMVYDGDESFAPESFVIGQLKPEKGWGLAKVDLTNFAGHTVRIGFDCYAVTNHNVILDNITVTEAPEESIVMTGADSMAKITGRDGTITVETTAAVPVTIACADGRILFSGTVSGNRSIAVSHGIYIVRAGTSAARLGL